MSRLAKILPVMEWLPFYQKGWLRCDLVAGRDGSEGHSLCPHRRPAADGGAPYPACDAGCPLWVLPPAEREV